jgi:alpha-ketoglutarate-dependent taurine dioxygenase
MSMTAKPEAQSFDVRPLSPLMAAEVVGLDLHRPLDTVTRDAVYDAFLKYQVLVFRDQALSKQEQIAFTEQFGTLEEHMARNRGSEIALLHVVSNLGPDGQPTGEIGSTGWHSDKSFRPLPSLATFLHAVTMPPDGGDTCFANMYASYEALPAEEKAMLDGMKVVHSWEHSRLHKDGYKVPEEDRIAAPPMSHPLVRTHPETGRKCLFLGGHASHLDGMPFDEGRAKVVALEQFATSERFTYRHKWRKGDMLMWDNRCLVHRADQNFDAAIYPRVLHRTCLRGTAPA